MRLQRAIKRGFLATGQSVGFYTDIAGSQGVCRSTRPGGGNISNRHQQQDAVDHGQASSTPRGDFLTILALLFRGAGACRDIVDPRS